jgi:guanylate kinase
VKNRQGHLYIISAPSGAGKTSLIKALLKSVDRLKVSVSHTTRPRRSNEVDGIDYHYISLEKYQQMLAEDDFLEHAQVFGNQYGTSKKAVEDLIHQGTDVILELDWQGARQIQKKMPKAISIFVLPPSLEALHQRLNNRAQDDENVIQKRMLEAKQEMSHYNEYQFLIINDDFDVAFNELRSLVTAERLRLERQAFEHADLIHSLIND